MSVIKKLAGQSVVYGLSSVVPRLLNYFLVALHSRVFIEAEYGIITELYAYIAILLVLLTFGLETGFFRFASKENRAAGEQTYSTIFYFLGGTSALFFALCWAFINPLSTWLGYPSQENYVLIVAGILSVDAWSAIIFDKLRWQERPLAFCTIKILSVTVNVGLNLLFLVGFPAWNLYDTEFGVGYVLLSNLIASCTSWLLALVMSGGLPNYFSWQILTPIIGFSFPLLISGLGGTTNEFLDRIFIKWLTPAEDPMAELGIYGANVKIAVLLVLFVQMFKFAAEPFFLSESDNKRDPKVYAMVTKYFTYFTLLAVVGISFFLPVFQYFVGSRFRVALDVIPILLVANLLYGFYFNVSFWYKITKRTWYGVLLTFVGAGITIIINLLLTPLISYYGAAIARVGSYLAMSILCIWIGQRFFPIPYDLRRILISTVITGVILTIGWFLPIESTIWLLAVRSIMLIVLLEIILRLENESILKVMQRWTRR